MPRSCLELSSECIQNLCVFSSSVSCAITQGQRLRTPFQNWNWTRKRVLLLRSLKKPRTRSWKMVRFSRVRICGATNALVENGSLQSRAYLWRHKHACGKGPLGCFLYSAALLGTCRKRMRSMLWSASEWRRTISNSSKSAFIPVLTVFTAIKAIYGYCCRLLGAIRFGFSRICIWKASVNLLKPSGNFTYHQV
jgi:hypothetical protein